MRLYLFVAILLLGSCSADDARKAMFRRPGTVVVVDEKGGQTAVTDSAKIDSILNDR